MILPKIAEAFSAFHSKFGTLPKCLEINTKYININDPEFCNVFYPANKKNSPILGLLYGAEVVDGNFGDDCCFAISKCNHKMRFDAECNLISELLLNVNSVTGEGTTVTGKSIKRITYGVQCKVLNKEFIDTFGLPTYATQGSAAVDLRACISESIVIKEGDTVLIPTGIAISIGEPSIMAVILPRSGLGHKQGLVLGNGSGVIDSDYQGEIFVSAWNRKSIKHQSVDTVQKDEYAEHGENVIQWEQIDQSVIINPGDRIAQMVFVPVMQVNFAVVDDFVATERGAGGFGHTGK